MLTPSVLRTPRHAPLVCLIPSSPDGVRPRRGWSFADGPGARPMASVKHRSHTPRATSLASAVCRIQTAGVSPFSPSHCGSPLPTGGGLSEAGCVCLAVTAVHSMDASDLGQAGIVLDPAPPYGTRETQNRR